jgi:hypothetical protein
MIARTVGCAALLVIMTIVRHQHAVRDVEAMWGIENVDGKGGEEWRM